MNVAIPKLHYRCDAQVCGHLSRNNDCESAPVTAAVCPLVSSSAPYNYTDQVFRPGDHVIRWSASNLHETVGMRPDAFYAFVKSLNVKGFDDFGWEETSGRLFIAHHGIVVGPDRVLESNRGAGIRIVDFAHFGVGWTVRLVTWPQPKYTADEVVARALNCFENRADLPFMDMSFNCEHLATLCAEGRPHSVSVDAALQRIVSWTFDRLCSLVWFIATNLSTVTIVWILIICIIIYIAFVSCTVQPL